MVFDFSKICKTYDAKIYKRSDFEATRCPNCPSIGRLNLHGSYWRHVLYFSDHGLNYDFIEIKRIRCISCETTHAVMPGDIIPYKLLSLIVFFFILKLFYTVKMSVMKIAAKCGFSFQLVYSVLATFLKHASRITIFLREIFPGMLQAKFNGANIISFIRRPHPEFQSEYIKLNKRPCFMCKFLDSANAPPIGQMPALLHRHR